MRRMLITLYVLTTCIASAQENSNIVEVIDQLTINWDQGAINLRTYQGIQEFCLHEGYRKATVELLDEIHHWDTLLYHIVQKKFDRNKDKEAAKTLEDIEKLESEYSTLNFKNFIQDECKNLKTIEDSFDQNAIKKYERDIREFEKELNKYIISITFRIDIVDEHIHHLKFD